MQEKIRKSIVDMLMCIDDVRLLERTHRLIQYIYTQEERKRAGQPTLIFYPLEMP